MNGQATQPPPVGPNSQHFSIFVPINYEDTDAGGIVYYPNYLAYMERARNACLREMGYPLAQLVEVHQLLFVVTNVNIRYLSPGKLDDNLEITLAIKSFKGASIIFHQSVIRDATLLVEAEVKLAVVNSNTLKPRKLPEFLKTGLLDWARPGV